MKKRRGNVLVISIIVMLFLAIVSGAIFGIAYINTRSAEQQFCLFKARSAANSLLFSVASVISSDIVNSADKMPVAVGETVSADFADGPISARVTVTREKVEKYVVEGSAVYAGHSSEVRGIDVIKRAVSDDVTCEWRWRKND